MTSSESEERLPSPKRSRTIKSGEDGSAAGEKKSRGRPRVDAQDATAADRRRTQIRLAQRAYRQRKETTIASLKAENAHLQSTIEQMNKMFARLRESTLESGVLTNNPSLSHDFNLAAESFTIFAKTANEHRIEEDDEAGENGEGLGGGNVGTDLASRAANATEKDAQSVGWGYSRIDTHSGSDSAHFYRTYADSAFTNVGTYGQPSINGDLARGRQVTVGENFDQSRFSENATDQQPVLPFGIVNLDPSEPFQPPSPRTYPVHIPNPNFAPPSTNLSAPAFYLPDPMTIKNLAHITTQSLYAPSFAGRLSRMAAETAFQLLIVADTRPAAMSYVFRFSLPTLTPEQLLDRFRLLVSRHPADTLDNWDIPYIQLGGSGTHYPRRDASGQIIRIQNSWKVQPLGPLEDKRANFINVEDGRLMCVEGIDFTGLEGEWFDAHDVECYLQEQHACKLHAKSQFVECEIMEEENDQFSRFEQYDTMKQRISRDGSNSPSPSPSHKSTSTMSSSSAAITPPPNCLGLPDALCDLKKSFPDAFMRDSSAEYPKHNNFNIPFDQVLGLDPSMAFDYGWSSASGGNRGLHQRPTQLKQKRKKKVWVDVNKLLDELLKKGVCLGRGPAFHKRHVEKALQRAIVGAF